MNKTKFFMSLVMAFSVLFGQVGTVLAAPALQESAPIAGTVHSITLDTDPSTGITTVIVEIKGQPAQTVRISQNTAAALGLVGLDGDGNPVINNLALGHRVEIDPATIIGDQAEEQHPVGNALATFFSDVAGLDYETVMNAHEKGAGFGVIAQALWMTKQLGGDSQVFKALLEAKATGDYSDFSIGGVAPQNWGQLRKAILDGKKLDKVNKGNDQGNNKDKTKDKGNDKDKDKPKDNGGGNDKDKEKTK